MRGITILKQRLEFSTLGDLLIELIAIVWASGDSETKNTVEKALAKHGIKHEITKEEVKV